MDEVKNEENKKRWAKIINKNKDGLIIVPPHDKETSIPTVTLTWDQFNANFDFDEKDKTKCYLKDGSEFVKTFAELPITKRDVKPTDKVAENKSKKNFKKGNKKPFNKKYKNNTDKPNLSKELKNDIKKAVKEVKPLVDKAIKEAVEFEEKGTKFVSTTKLEIARTLKKLPKKPKKTETIKEFDKEYTMSIGDMIKAKN